MTSESLAFLPLSKVSAFLSYCFMVLKDVLISSNHIATFARANYSYIFSHSYIFLVVLFLSFIRVPKSSILALIFFIRKSLHTLILAFLVVDVDYLLGRSPFPILEIPNENLKCLKLGFSLQNVVKDCLILELSPLAHQVGQLNKIIIRILSSI